MFPPESSSEPGVIGFQQPYDVRWRSRLIPIHTGQNDRRNRGYSRSSPPQFAEDDVDA